MQFGQLLGQVIGRENERKALVNLRIGREPLPPGNSVNFKLWWLMIKNPLNSRNQIIQQKRPEQKFHHRHHHLPVCVCSSAELGAIQTSLPNTRRLRRGSCSAAVVPLVYICTPGHIHFSPRRISHQHKPPFPPASHPPPSPRPQFCPSISSHDH